MTFSNFINVLLFWLSVCVIGYTYLLYPLILFFFWWLRDEKRSNSEPRELALLSVSIVISAYNEDKIIEEKLRNLESIEYPREKIEFVIGSDGSSDRTNALLRAQAHPNLKIKTFAQRRGKAAVLNDLILSAAGEIIVFSDANTFYTPTTVKELIRHFGDPSVGGVVGELLLESQTKTVGAHGEKIYWSYENTLKKQESDVRTTLGATGPVYAIRKELFKPLPTTKVVMDDLLIPLKVIEQGYNVKYNPDAIAYEKTSESIALEFKRKVRISAANFHCISEFAHLLHPRYGFASFALWSHKMLRWFVPFFLLSAIASSAILAIDSEFFWLVFIGEVSFLALATGGFVSEKSKLHIGVLGLPYYFLAMNTALLVGFIRFLLKRQKPAWDILRHTEA